MARSGAFYGSWRRSGRLAGLVLALGLVSTPLKAETPLSLDYRLYAGGLHAISFNTEFMLNRESYEAVLKLRSDGWVDTFFSFSMEARADGRQGDGGLEPNNFRTANRWRSDEERLVEISYDEPGSLPRTQVVPSIDEDEREPVPDELKRNTLDPLSALVQTIQALTRSGSCEATAAVFDGRRRYDLAARDLGETTLEPSDTAPYGGPAIKCGIEIERVVGRWKKRSERWKNAGRPVIHAFLARLKPDEPLVPVRVEAQNKIGQVRIHLVGIDGALIGE